MPLAPAIDRIYQEIGYRARDRRKQLGMVQDDVAAVLGLSRASIANLETGRQRILIHQVFELADVLDMDVGALLGLAAGARRDVFEVDPGMWPWLQNEKPIQ